MGGLGGYASGFTSGQELIEQANMNTTFVYFIREKLGDLAPVKIGVANNVDQRLGDLQVGNSRQLEIVTRLGPMSRKQAQITEKQLHRKFCKHHIRGEWFSGVVLTRLAELKEVKNSDDEKHLAEYKEISTQE